jgi:hypothetical protein
VLPRDGNSKSTEGCWKLNSAQISAAGEGRSVLPRQPPRSSHMCEGAPYVRVGGGLFDWRFKARGPLASRVAAGDTRSSSVSSV